MKSVWALEVLLLLTRKPVRAWSAQELDRELRSSLRVVTDVLVQFEQGGLVKQQDGLYRLEPAGDTARLVQELEAEYAVRPLEVVRTIFAGSAERIQMFADAFKMRKD
jgi:hypothetical protein